MYSFLVCCPNVPMSQLTHVKKTNVLTLFNVFSFLFTLFFPNLHVEFAIIYQTEESSMNIVGRFL